MVDVPNERKLKAAFGKHTESDTLDRDQFKNLCYEFYLSPTKNNINDLFQELDKNEDDRLSFEEMQNLVTRQWTPMPERKLSFLKDLSRCRKSDGPISREELKEILQRGNDDEALSDEDINFCFDRMDLNGDDMITDEEISELIYHIEAESRATSRATSRCRSGQSRKSRSSSSSSERKRSGSSDSKRSGSGKDRSGSSDNKRSGSAKSRSSVGSNHSGRNESHKDNTQDDNEITTTETQIAEAENVEEKTLDDQTTEAAPEVEESSKKETDESTEEDKPNEQNTDNINKSEENKDEKTENNQETEKQQEE